MGSTDTPQARPVRSDAEPPSVRLLGGLMRAVLVVVAIGFALNLLAVQRAAQEQDRLVAESARSMLDGLVTLQRRQVAAGVRDYTYWDEAIERLPGAWDAEWWELNAGTFVVDSFDYAFSLAVDGTDAPRLLSREGEDTLIDPDPGMLTPSLRALFEEARALPDSPLAAEAVASGVVDVFGEPHLAAAARFQPEDGASPANPDPGALLVFAYSLEQILAEAASIMGVSDMRLGGAAPERGAAVPFTLVDGSPAGVAAWTPPRPGTSMVAAMSVPLLGSVVAIAMLVVFLTIRTRRLALELHDDDRARHELAARNQSILESAGEGIFGVDDDGVVVFANRAALEAIGFEPSGFIGRDPHELIGCIDRNAELAGGSPCPIRQVLATGTAHASDAVEFTRRDGSAFPVEYVITPVQHAGRVIGAVVVFRDITQRRQAEADVRYRAYFDELTGLPNRSMIMEHLRRELVRSRRSNSALGAMFLDLDNFKAVNDSLGHAAGDVLLRRAADRLQASVRASDIVGRLGGDEFVVLLPGVGSPSDSAQVAEKMLGTLAQSFDVDGNEAFVGASIGIALHPDDGDDAEDLLRKADLAMYRAKNEGRNTYRFYQPTMTALALERRQLHLDLRHAIDAGELDLVYQPVVDMRDGRTVYLEASIRWQHEQRGAVDPSEVLSFADETGSTDEIGAWAVDAAVRQLADWRAAGFEVRVAINASRRQVAGGVSVPALRTALERHGVPPAVLLVEIGEGVLIDRDAEFDDWMRGLGELGVRLVLDDVTGFASVRGITRAQLEALKLDRSVVADLLDGEAHEAVVSAMIGMGAALGVPVAAQAVDTEAQRSWLLEHGCHLGQGAVLGPPREAGEVFAA